MGFSQLQVCGQCGDAVETDAHTCTQRNASVMVSGGFTDRDVIVTGIDTPLFLISHDGNGHLILTSLLGEDSGCDSDPVHVARAEFGNAREERLFLATVAEKITQLIDWNREECEQPRLHNDR